MVLRHTKQSINTTHSIMNREMIVWCDDRKKVKGEVLPRTGHEGSRWEWVVNATPRPLYSLETPSTHCTGGCDGEGGWPGPVWTSAESLAPTGIRFPDRPARSELLYRLSYPGPWGPYCTKQINTRSEQNSEFLIIAGCSVEDTVCWGLTPGAIADRQRALEERRICHW